MTEGQINLINLFLIWATLANNVGGLTELGLGVHLLPSNPGVNRMCWKFSSDRRSCLRQASFQVITKVSLKVI